MSEFRTLERLTADRKRLDGEWRAEVARLGKVYSTRLIADRAGVTHTAVWKIMKRAAA